VVTKRNHNIIVNTALGAVCIHGGRDNIIENNIFVDGKERQMTLQPHGALMQSNVFSRNIVVSRNSDAVLWFCWADQWRPDLFSQCDSNLFWYTTGLDPLKSDRPLTPEGSFRKWQAAGLDKNSIIADPGFVAMERDDYRLREDSPAFKLGFQPIPVELIGPAGFRRSEAQIPARGPKP